MKNTLTKLSVGLVTVISGGAYVPVIPSELSPGLAELPDMRAYQYEAGSDRTDYRLVEENGSTTIKALGPLPDADFTDEDGNGLISVGVFTDKKGQSVYKKIPDDQYAQMAGVGGSAHNPQETELVSLFDALSPTKAEAAIAIDATSQGYANSTSLTFAHTVSGSDRILMVQLYTFQGTQPSITGITYNGVALTSKGSRVSDLSGYTQQWSLVAPATGANNIVISMNSSQVFATAVSYTGVDQTTPHPDATVTGSVTGTSLSATMTTTVADSWLVLAGRSPSRAPTAGASTIVRKLNGTSGDAGWTLDSDGGRSTGSNSLNWSYSPSQTTYYVMSVIAPSTAAPAAGLAPGADTIIYYNP